MDLAMKGLRLPVRMAVLGMCSALLCAGCLRVSPVRRRPIFTRQEPVNVSARHILSKYLTNLGEPVLFGHKFSETQQICRLVWVPPYESDGVYSFRIEVFPSGDGTLTTKVLKVDGSARIVYQTSRLVTANDVARLFSGPLAQLDTMSVAPNEDDILPGIDAPVRILEKVEAGMYVVIRRISDETIDVPLRATNLAGRVSGLDIQRIVRVNTLVRDVEDWFLKLSDLGMLREFGGQGVGRRQ